MNMTLGKRITLGFTIVLLIAAILGGIGVVNMNTAKDILMIYPASIFQR
jgi:CHASE3 domain sensor protein